MTRALRRFARQILRTPERLMHATRRRNAEAMLRGAKIRGVLVLCLGNICRSPYAALRLREALGPSWVGAVDSAGFIGPGRRSPWEAVEVAGERGVSLAAHRSRTVEADDATAFDLVVVMEAPQRRRFEATLGVRATRVLVLGDLDPEPIEQRTIVDPFGRGSDEFRRSYARIDRCVARLAALLTEARSSEAPPAR